MHAWNQEFVASSPRGPALRGARRARSSARCASWRACGIDLARDAAAARGRLLHEPRGAAARLRGGAHPPRLAHRRLVRLLGAHALDRRAHAPARRRARRVLRAASTTRSACKLGPTATPDERARAVRAAEPDAHPGPADAHHPHGRRARRASALPPLLRAVARRRAPGRVGLRPDARQHVPHRVAASRRATSTRSWPRSTASSRACRARARWPGGVHVELTGEDVTECLGGADGGARGAARRPLRDAVRPAPERPPVARPRLPRRRADAAVGTVMAVVRALAVVGTGLIGASVGLAARARRRRARRRLGSRPGARWPPPPSAARSRRLADSTTALDGAELAVVAAPVTALPGPVRAVLDASAAGLRPSPTSARRRAASSRGGRRRPRFVGGHPICGSEARGAGTRRAELFDGATWFLTPVAATDPERLPAAARLRRGARRGAGRDRPRGARPARRAHEPPAARAREPAR